MFKYLAIMVLMVSSWLPAAAQVAFWENEWPITDFTKTSVNFSEVMSGGPPKDGIPALASVDFITVGEADIPGREPVIAVEIDGELPRAYPLRYLTWHEIANDVIGGVPVAVTFCPLCNSGIVFDRRKNGQILTFGVTGKLRFSDMIMFDRETESWWQQFTGEAIVGELLGDQLAVVISWTESMEEFAMRNPDGLVMAEPTGVSRPYGQNPYNRYDSSARPFLYSGEEPPFGIEPLSRVVRVGGRAWPLARLADVETLEEAGLKIVWASGMASALDTRQIARGRNIGSIRVYDTDGLPVEHEVVFAFAFHAFTPDGEWMLGE
ncbi:MAG: DUF3179 domain-containing protein [Rhodobacteraceae bacterium]|nr:DUF3179 domain-containing protein [Paracoccaceae bacterium]